MPKYHLYADPESIPFDWKNEIADELFSRLSLSLEEKLQLRQQLDKVSRSRKLAKWLDEESYRYLNDWWRLYARQHDIPRNALFFVKDYQRSYPFGKLLGQVLHTIQNQKEEKTDQGLPTGGLELYFNSYLQGKNGRGS